MPGGSTTQQQQQQQNQQSQQTQQQQSSTTAPWQPAIGPLTGILNTVSGNSTAPTAAQSNAIAELEANAQNGTNFGTPVASAASGLLNGGNPAYSGMLGTAYDTLRTNLTPYANGSMVGNNEALKSQLGTIANDTQNAVESQFAAAGRGGPGGVSPAEAQAIARGTAQGEAPVIAAQYNTDVGNQINANNILENAGFTTGTGLNSMAVGNQTAGLNFASAYPGILNANAQGLLNAGNIEQQLPYLGTGLQESQILPIAGLGAQSSGSSSASGVSTGNSTGQSTTTQEQPLGPTLLGGILGATSLLGSGGLNVLGSLAPLLLASDARLKKDIRHVGILNSGDNLYQFKFKGDPSMRKHVGVLAQEVEQRHPEDVHDINGVKHVDYAGVLRRAAA
ncbi:MAG TPA: tail fiber domain-containing protein [Candidatus Cybelea sp.]|nr:tail fiber domain-containing protein [Candidatus Cybelea sp.]